MFAEELGTGVPGSQVPHCDPTKRCSLVLLLLIRVYMTGISSETRFEQ